MTGSPTARGGGPDWRGPVLVLEDDAIIAMDLRDTLESAGATVESVSRVDDAMDLLGTTPFAVALLDVDVAGTPSLPVARALAERGVPFLWTTGYAGGDALAAFPSAPVLQKPYAPEEVLRRLAEVLG